MELLIQLLGSIALLLWGLRMVRTGVMRAYGTSFITILGADVGTAVAVVLASQKISSISPLISTVAYPILIAAGEVPRTRWNKE